MKKILVTTDASEYSRRGLTTAIEYAKQFQSEIELLHVVSQPLNFVDVYSGGYIYTYSQEQIDEMGKQVFEETLRGIDTGQVKISMKVVTGYPASAILKEISRGVDLIVMGSRGHGPIAGALTGSVTLRVLADSSCPVLVVK